MQNFFTYFISTEWFKNYSKCFRKWNKNTADQHSSLRELRLVAFLSFSFVFLCYNCMHKIMKEKTEVDKEIKQQTYIFNFCKITKKSTVQCRKQYIIFSIHIIHRFCKAACLQQTDQHFTSHNSSVTFQFKQV